MKVDEPLDAGGGVLRPSAMDSPESHCSTRIRLRTSMMNERNICY